MTLNILLNSRKNSEKSEYNAFEPEFFRLKNKTDKENLEQLLNSKPSLRVFDQINSQAAELTKIRNPAIPLNEQEKQKQVSELLGENPDEFGTWVYYPWSDYLVHILDKEDFFELRTSRNKYKIKPEEQIELSKKKVGIIGLSVGKTIAMTMTIERLFGEVRLADFDDLELSNLNRLQAGLHELGNSKVMIAAREIAELDPYIKVVPFWDGITESNIDDFLTYNGKLDVLIEECDGLDVKILSRLRAKAFKIPVIMETNDRGMIDIERFDLEPERSILHGLIDHLPTDNLKQLKNLSNKEKLPYLTVMVGIENISRGLRASIPEIGKTITTWPQLASSVMLGGALVADTCRRVFLDQFQVSGRFYVDFEEALR